MTGNWERSGCVMTRKKIKTQGRREHPSFKGKGGGDWVSRNRTTAEDGLTKRILPSGKKGAEVGGF